MTQIVECIFDITYLYTSFSRRKSVIRALKIDMLIVYIIIYRNILKKVERRVSARTKVLLETCWIERYNIITENV